MELVISKKINYIIPVSLFFCSFVLSLVQLKQTSLPFVLPMLILTFCSSYGHLAIYLLSVTCGLLLTQQIFTLIVIYTLLCVLFVLNIFRVMKTRYLPVFMSLLTIPFLYMNQYPYYDIAFIALFNLINSCFYMELMPLLVHQSSDLYDRKRLMIMVMIIETMIGALAFYHVTYCMIILRYFLLFAIFYLGIEAVMPTLLYTSFLLIVMMPALKEEMLAMILPMSFFFIRQPENKVLFTSLYMLSHMILPLFIGYDERYYAFVVIISAVLFLFSPKIKNKMLSISPDFQEVTYHHQLKNKAESFASLYQQLIDIFKEETKKTNISEYIGFVYEEVCSGCPSRDYCFYSQEGMSRLGKLINKGMTSELDLKDIDYIHRHCLNPDDYLESIDHQQKSFHKMVKVNSVNENMKKELFQEFAVMGRVFENFSKNIKADDEERQIKEQLLAYKFDVLYVKKNGFNQNYTLEIGLEDISSEMIEEELIPILENYLGETLDVVSIDQRHHYLGYASVVLRHELKYAIMFSRQQYALDSSQCGDSYISFDHDHHHYIALSDGMGQGYVAHKESELTLNVLYQLIHNDIGLKDTLNTVNALLKIKNQGDMYTTLDLLDFNLINGRVKVIKYGANDSFLLRHNRIDVITSHSLPVGMAGRLKILSYDVKVQAGDIFIMTSDGVGEHFLRLLETHKEKIAEMDVYEIASFLFNQAFPEKKLDDMTILVMKVISRK